MSCLESEFFALAIVPSRVWQPIPTTLLFLVLVDGFSYAGTGPGPCSGLLQTFRSLEGCQLLSVAVPDAAYVNVAVPGVSAARRVQSVTDFCYLTSSSLPPGLMEFHFLSPAPVTAVSLQGEGVLVNN